MSGADFVKQKGSIVIERIKFCSFDLRFYSF